MVLTEEFRFLFTIEGVSENILTGLSDENRL